MADGCIVRDGLQHLAQREDRLWSRQSEGHHRCCAINVKSQSKMKMQHLIVHMIHNPPSLPPPVIIIDMALIHTLLSVFFSSACIVS